MSEKRVVSDGEQQIEVNEAEAPRIDVHWRETPTILVDQMMGFAAADGVVRVTLGELAYTPGGAMPHARPVITLAASHVGWRRLLEQMGAVATAITNTEIESGDDE